MNSPIEGTQLLKDREDEVKKLKKTLRKHEKAGEWPYAVSECKKLIALLNELNLEEQKKKFVIKLEGLAQQEERWMRDLQDQYENRPKEFDEIDLTSFQDTELKVENYLNLLRKANTLEARRPFKTYDLLIRCLAMIKKSPNQFLELYPKRKKDKNTLQKRLHSVGHQVEELIEEEARKQKLIKNQISSLTKQLQIKMTTKEIIEAHTIAIEIQDMYSEEIKKAIPGALKKVLLREEKIYKTFQNQQEKIHQELGELDTIITTNIEAHNFVEAQEKMHNALNLIKKSKDEALIQEWEKKQHQLKEQEAEWIKEQNERARNEASMLRDSEERDKHQKKLQTFERLQQAILEGQSKSQWNIVMQNCIRIIEFAKILEKEEEVPNYVAILASSTEKFNSDAQHALEQQTILLQKAKEIEKIIEVDDEVLPMEEELEISEFLGDIDADVDDMLDQIGSLLETQRVEVKTEVSSNSVIRSAAGEVIELNSTTSIQEIETPTGDTATQKTHNFMVKSGFDNPFEDYIEEAIIEDIIPYNFEISEVFLNGDAPLQEPDRNLLKDGLQFQWVLKDIAPKQSVQINYNLKQRVSRTIILPLKDQLKIIKTHTNVNKLHLEGLYDVKMKFANHYHQKIEGIVIEDIVPEFYVFEVKQPRDINPDTQIKQKAGSLVKWNISHLDQDQSLLHRYQLLEIFRFEDLKIAINQIYEDAFEELEQGKLSVSLNKFADIINLFEDYK